jgi:type I site-specific restriction endonuclease
MNQGLKMHTFLTFFDLIIIDECHRGRKKGMKIVLGENNVFQSSKPILVYKLQRETMASNTEYFENLFMSYSLKYSIDDGFAPKAIGP